MLRLLAVFRSEQGGATAIEYGLLAGLIAGVIIASVGVIDGRIAGAFTTVASKLEEHF